MNARKKVSLALLLTSLLAFLTVNSGAVNTSPGLTVLLVLIWLLTGFLGSLGVAIEMALTYDFRDLC